MQRPAVSAEPQMVDIRPRAMPLWDQLRNAVVTFVLLVVIVLAFSRACSAH